MHEHEHEHAPNRTCMFPKTTTMAKRAQQNMDVALVLAQKVDAVQHPGLNAILADLPTSVNRNGFKTKVKSELVAMVEQSIASLSHPIYEADIQPVIYRGLIRRAMLRSGSSRKKTRKAIHVHRRHNVPVGACKKTLAKLAKTALQSVGMEKLAVSDLQDVDVGDVSPGPFEGALGAWIDPRSVNSRGRTMKSFGLFRCPRHGFWVSAHAHSDSYQQCKRCRMNIEPHLLWCNRDTRDESKSKEDHEGPNARKPHRQDLCGRCTELGFPCWLTSRTRTQTQAQTRTRARACVRVHTSTKK